jgi:formiminotetrahydrofolate cyclodeaminase
VRRAEAIQTTLRAATETPLDCARACAEVIGLAQRAGENGYAGVISDAGVGVLAAHTALRSAALNVYINAPSLQDREFAQQAIAEVERLLEAGGRRSEAVYALVRGRLG